MNQMKNWASRPGPAALSAPRIEGYSPYTTAEREDTGITSPDEMTEIIVSHSGSP